MSDARKTRAQLIEEIGALRAELAAARGGLERAGGPRPSTGEDRYHEVLEHARTILIETDEGGRFTYVSPSVTEILGFTPEELLHESGQGLLHEEDRESLEELFRKTIASGQGGKVTLRVRHRDGGCLWLETSFSGYRTAGDETRSVALARDVTQLREAHEALLESGERYRALAENASDVIAELDAQGRFLFVSPNCQQVIGLPPDVFMGRDVANSPLQARLDPNSWTAPPEDFWRDLVAGRTGRVEFAFRHPDGGRRWLECTGRDFATRHGGRRSVLVSRDVTERVEAERELRRSEERYRVLLEQAGYVVSETDSEGRSLYLSPNLEDFCGFTASELVGTTTIFLIHPDDAERVADRMVERTTASRPTFIEPFRFQRKEGTWRWAEALGISYVRSDGERVNLSLIRDITDRMDAERERRELEERMQHAQKLEGLGVMAGGIAHDFNNLLTPILGDTSLALLDLPRDSPVRVRLQKVQKAAHRAAGLTNQMLAYAGEEPLHVEVLNLSRLVQEMAQLLETAASHEAILVYDLAQGLPAVEGDPARVSQIIMNLITNASEALTEAEGRIVLRTGSADLERSELDRMILGSELGPGRFVYVEVSDTGRGMDAETRGRIFDPFFTTKFTGRGLGLAAVLGIVRAHQGAIDLETEPGRGTRFRVLFPAATRGLAAPAPPPGPPEAWRAEGTVLVVDDEEGVRDLARDTLERAGFSVLCARDGREALELFTRHADEIRLVLLDRTMPAASGEETFLEIRRLRPRAKIVLVSGYSKATAAERLAGKGLDGFLQKPFLPAALLARVREALEGAR